MSGARFLKGPKTPILAALPTGMTATDDGREILFLADATNGVVWRLRYRHYAADGVTPNPSVYKWEFVGGGDLFSKIPTIESGGPAGAWNNTPTVGPDVIVPLAGDYEVSWALTMYVLNGQSQAGVAFGNTTPTGLYSYCYTANASAANYDSGGQSDRFTAVSAGTTMRLRYFSSWAASANVGYRSLRVRPVRVG